jgi:hypothetical protein
MPNSPTEMNFVVEGKGSYVLLAPFTVIENTHQWIKRDLA